MALRALRGALIPFGEPSILLTARQLLFKTVFQSSSMSDHSGDEASSVGSTVSATHQQVACPYCNWAKKQRYLFKHIINNHHQQLYSVLGTPDQIKTDLEDGNLLRLNISLYSPDDEFKEFDRTPKPIYGCLACLNTYEQSGRAKAHWKNSKKCHLIHTKKVKIELKKVEEEYEANKDKAWIDELSEKDLIFCIEKFRRFYYRLFAEDIPFLQSQSYNMGLDIPAKYKNYEIQDPLELKNRLELVKAYKTHSSFLNSLKIYIWKKFTFPFEWNLVNPFDYKESYEDAGLLPVGSSYEEFAKNRVIQSETRQKQIEKEQEIIINQRMEKEKLKLLEEIKKLKDEASKPKDEKLILEPIVEEPPKKEKRNSFTIPRSDLSNLPLGPSQPICFPTIVSDTKKKREPKVAPK